MSDNQGIRVGAAGHFSSRMTSALLASGQITAAQAMDTFADFTSQALDVLNGFEAQATPTVRAVAAAPAYVAAQTAQVAVPAGLASMVDTSTVVVSQAAMPEVQNASQLANEGIDNGPLPEWLGPICAKYGVGKVFDNRHQLAGAPTRPWFRQAGVPKGQNAKGFWPDTK